MFRHNQKFYKVVLTPPSHDQNATRMFGRIRQLLYKSYDLSKILEIDWSDVDLLTYNPNNTNDQSKVIMTYDAYLVEIKMPDEYSDTQAPVVENDGKNGDEDDDKNDGENDDDKDDGKNDGKNDNDEDDDKNDDDEDDGNTDTTNKNNREYITSMCHEDCEYITLLRRVKLRVDGVVHIKDCGNKDLKFWKSIVLASGSLIKFVPNEFRTRSLCQIAVSTYRRAIQYADPQFRDEAMCLDAVKSNPMLLKYAATQTPEMVLRAVQNNPAAWLYVKDQNDPELMKRAIKQKSGVIEYIKNPTLEMRYFAIDNYASLRFIKNQNVRMCLMAMKSRYTEFRYAKIQTYKLCVSAVRGDGTNLKYVWNKTPELILDALKKCGKHDVCAMMPHVDDYTAEICMAAVARTGAALKWVPDQHKSQEICDIAVRDSPLSLRYVDAKFQTPEMCSAAVAKNTRSIRYVIEQTPELCLAAVSGGRNDAVNLEFVRSQTPEICMAAIKQSSLAIKFVKKFTPDLCMYIVQRHGGQTLRLIPTEHRTLEICMAAAERHGLALKWIPECHKTPGVCMVAIQENPKAIQYVKNPSYQMMSEAVVGDHSTIKMIANPPVGLYAFAIQNYQLQSKFATDIRPKIAGLFFRKHQTIPMIMAAVRSNGLHLADALIQTPEIAMEAVKQNGRALQFVKTQTPEICLAAVMASVHALQYVETMTTDIINVLGKPGVGCYCCKGSSCLCGKGSRCFCNTGSGVILKILPERHHTEEVYLAVVSAFPDELSNTRFQSHAVCMAAVSRKGMVLQYVKDKTPELCMAAVCQNGCALEFVDSQTDELCLKAVQNTPHALKYVKNQTHEICKAALIFMAYDDDRLILRNQYGSCINQNVVSLVREWTDELSHYAVSQNWRAILRIKNETPELCMTALKEDIMAINYIENPTAEMFDFVES